MNRCRRPLLLIVLLAPGCSTVGVRRTEAPDLFESLRVSALSAADLSPRSWQTLRSLDLEDAQHTAPVEALRKLQVLAEAEPRPDFLFALAEMCYLIGRAEERGDCGRAIPFYYLCAGYAFHYLYGAESETPVEKASPFDPRYRLACELYNAGLAKCIRAAQRIGQLDPRQTLSLPTPDGKGFTLSVAHHGFLWKPEEFGTLMLAQDYQVVGLTRHRTFGLGVPLIATRAADAPHPGHAFYPPSVSFPVTAFFRFGRTLAEMRDQRAGRLELYNPLAIQSIKVRGVPTPLETDLTTPLAYFLAQADLELLGLTGFLKPDKVQSLSGIYMMEPYQQGKIPVVMVHGLASAPYTWSTMFNELRADPFLRQHFQFWFYFYPTAVPFLSSAADLRDSLARLRTELDPGHCDPCLENMVFVGHSMGGLMSRLMTIDSGDDFWRLVARRPFDELKASEPVKHELGRTFFFERQTCVKRAVFLGTPHRGSKLSPSLPARIARKFMSVPRSILLIVEDVAKANPPEFLVSLKPESAPTSLDLLAPDAPALMVLDSRPRAPDVHYHSVIGVAPPCGLVRLECLFSGACEEGDGVVPYASAHLDAIDSELIVPAEHSAVHHHPLAVQEVRKILMEHLKLK